MNSRHSIPDQSTPRKIDEHSFFNQYSEEELQALAYSVMEAPDMQVLYPVGQISAGTLQYFFGTAESDATPQHTSPKKRTFYDLTEEEAEKPKTEAIFIDLTDEPEKIEKYEERQTKRAKQDEILPPTKLFPYFDLTNSTDIKDLEKAAHFTYISSDKDRLDLLAVGPVAMLSKNGIAPLGLYAKKDIPAGTFLCFYLGKEYSNEEAKDIRDKHYVMQVGNHVVDSKNDGNISRFANNSLQCYNTVFDKGCDNETEKEWVELVTIADIKKGEQILVSYSKGYKFGFKPLYLHASDNDLTALDIHYNYYEYYHPKKINASDIKFDLSLIGIKPTDTFYVPELMMMLFEEQPLENFIDFNEVNLPLLRVSNEDGKLLERGEQERINLMMVAAYLGRADVVKWLLDRDKNAGKIQQTISAKTPLHLAMMGAAKATDHEKHLQTIQLLAQDSNLFLIEDKDYKIALFDAIDHAPASYLTNLLKEAHVSIFKILQSRAKKNGLDAFLYAVFHEKYEHANIILQSMLKVKSQHHTYFKRIEKMLAKEDSSEFHVLLLERIQKLKDFEGPSKKYGGPRLFSQPKKNVQNHNEKDKFISKLASLVKSKTEKKKRKKVRL